MNGISNHIHMLVNLSSDVALSQFMLNLKRGSSIWAKSHRELFPDFMGWGKEYYAFSYGVEQKDAIVNYIMHQEEHHHIVNYDNEMRNIAKANECDYYEYN